MAELKHERFDSVLDLAARLAADGEIGNSNAIELLRLSHTADQLKTILSRYAQALTPQARGKLMLEAWVPMPDGVENQRFEPIFDKYPISERTYVTARGATVLNEVQYYNGHMLQSYGECANLAEVRRILAGSGYQPMLLRYADGRETAVAHYWAHHLSDTSLKPYNAMFFIIAVVDESIPAEQACLRADDNGFASVLSVLDGHLDPHTGVYTNRASFYYVRLLDSTQVAIDVGRERMGLDKRFGTIDVACGDGNLTAVVRDAEGALVARASITAGNDTAAVRRRIWQAAQTAGVALTAHSRGMEQVYPGLGRIGDGPVVHWAWHTDIVPLLQAARPDDVEFDDASEIGAVIKECDFEPRVHGIIPNIRGAITGLAPGLPGRQRRVRIRPPADSG